MKILHTADLHLGKTLNEYNMLELQRDILNQILNIAIDEAVDVVVIAGDIYQNSVPQAEANTMFDSFITKLSKHDIKIIIVSGNHDSAERLNYGREIFKHYGIHLYCNSTVNKLSLTKNDQTVNFYIWPFVGTYQLKEQLNINNFTYEEGFKTLIEQLDIDYNQVNCFIGHSFYTNSSYAITSQSERELSVGTADNLDVAPLDQFDIAMFGHLHNPQKVKKELFRYSGSIMKYSFSEVNHSKSVVVYNIQDKQNITYQLHQLNPKLDLQVIEGKIEDLVKLKQNDNLVQIILTNTEVLPNPMATLRPVFANILEIKYKDLALAIKTEEHQEETTSTYQMFAKYYQDRTDKELTLEEQEYLQKLFAKVEGDGYDN